MSFVEVLVALGISLLVVTTLAVSAPSPNTPDSLGEVERFLQASRAEAASTGRGELVVVTLSRIVSDTTVLDFAPHVSAALPTGETEARLLFDGSGALVGDPVEFRGPSGLFKVQPDREARVP